MYGLKQAALLADKYLSDILTTAGYQPISSSLGLWRHITKPTLFSLYVDDFGVKYFNKDDLNHLHTAMVTKYTCKVDLTGRYFLGYTIDWNYLLDYVDLNMLDYIRHALEHLQYIMEVHTQYSPHKHIDKNWTNNGNGHILNKKILPQN